MFTPAEQRIAPPPGALGLAERRLGEQLRLVAVHGTVAGAEATEILAAALAAAARDGVRWTVVDLARCAALDEAGEAVLLAAGRSLAADGGALAVAGARGAVAERVAAWPAAHRPVLLARAGEALDALAQAGRPVPRARRSIAAQALPRP